MGTHKRNLRTALLHLAGAKIYPHGDDASKYSKLGVIYMDVDTGDTQKLNTVLIATVWQGGAIRDRAWVSQVVTR